MSKPEECSPTLHPSFFPHLVPSALRQSLDSDPDMVGWAVEGAHRTIVIDSLIHANSDQ